MVPCGGGGGGGGGVGVGGVDVEEGEDGPVGADAVGELVIKEGHGVGGALGLGERGHGGGVGDGGGRVGGGRETHAAEHAERRVSVAVPRERGQEVVLVVEGARRRRGDGV
jgi:hypothetical protein